MSPVGAAIPTLLSKRFALDLTFRRKKLMKIDHLGIAVKSLDETLKFYRDMLGLTLAGTEIVEDQGVEVAMLPIGESRVELLQAINESSPVAKFIEKRGAGIHHICIEVEDIHAQ